MMRSNLARTMVAATLIATNAPTALAQVASVEGFADVADLTIGAPVVLQATIVDSDRLSRKEAPDVPAGRVRMLIEAQVQNVLTAGSPVPGRITYLWDAPLDARGKPPKPKGTNVILFLRPVPGREGQFQLTSRNGQIARTPRSETAVRRVLADSRSSDLRDLRITGIGNAFHVRGSIPGESESQIFLTTASGRPVSLVVLARPGQPKGYSVALGDVIDDAARSVPRDTLMWYKLACALPRTLPAPAVADLEEADRTAVAADYRFVLDALGPCQRTLG